MKNRKKNRLFYLSEAILEKNLNEKKCEAFVQNETKNNQQKNKDKKYQRVE